MLMLAEILVCGVASGLFARCVLWHVPKLARMIWGVRQGRYACGEVWGGQHVDCACRAPATLDDALALSNAAMERHEARLFAACPSAFWLDKNFWGDKPHRSARPIRISSERRFDVSPLQNAANYQNMMGALNSGNTQYANTMGNLLGIGAMK